MKRILGKNIFFALLLSVWWDIFNHQTCNLILFKSWIHCLYIFVSCKHLFINKVEGATEVVKWEKMTSFFLILSFSLSLSIYIYIYIYAWTIFLASLVGFRICQLQPLPKGKPHSLSLKRIVLDIFVKATYPLFSQIWIKW